MPGMLVSNGMIQGQTRPRGGGGLFYAERTGMSLACTSHLSYAYVDSEIRCDQGHGPSFRDDTARLQYSESGPSTTHQASAIAPATQDIKVHLVFL